MNVSRYEQTPSFHSMNLHSFEDTKVHSSIACVWTDEMRRIQGGNAGKRTVTNLSRLVLFVQHILEHHVYVAKWNGRLLWIRTECKRHLPNDCSSMLLQKKIYMWVYVWFIYVHVLNAAFYTCPHHIKQAEVFLLRREHMSTHPLACWHQK